MQAVILTKDGHLYYHCPGCKGCHAIPVLIGKKEDKHWEWNGDLEKPTVAPSVKHFYPDSHYQAHPGLAHFCCHYHIRNGNIEYCSDCSHDHNGKTVPLPPFSEAEVKLAYAQDRGWCVIRNRHICNSCVQEIKLPRRKKRVSSQSSCERQ